MMKYEGEQLTNDFEEAFGVKMEDITERQMWWLIKLVKHCRGRCRSNAALHNYLNRNFPFVFSTKPAINEFTGETYSKLVIRKRG